MSVRLIMFTDISGHLNFLPFNCQCQNHSFVKFIILLMCTIFAVKYLRCARLVHENQQYRQFVPCGPPYWSPRSSHLRPFPSLPSPMGRHLLHQYHGYHRVTCSIFSFLRPHTYVMLAPSFKLRLLFFHIIWNIILGFLTLSN